jgi:alkylation response protein AidB-like acyl-CoA dehydrogenase
MYSRAASIYGGSAEIQRNIVADQVLGLRSAASRGT